MRKIALVFLSVALCVGCTEKPVLRVTVENPLPTERYGEIVEVPWELLEEGLENAVPDEILVCDSTGQELPSQVVYRNEKSPQALIFQLTLGGGARGCYLVKKGIRTAYVQKVHGRLVPERKDDFAWENEKVAYRMYGPALEATGEISNGLDVWMKCKDELMLEEWYKNGDYHRNHGKGMDGYAVGRTLGGGAMAPLADGKLVLGNNFTRVEWMEEGPLRISFCLCYAPYQVGGAEVTERRVITLDAGTRFNRIEETYEGLPVEGEVAAGIVLRPEEGERLCDTVSGLLGYWEPLNRNNGDDNGHTAIGLFFPNRMERIVEKDGHLLAVGKYGKTPFVYYAGSGWSLGGIKDAEDWFGILRTEKIKLENPLKIKIETVG